MNIKNNELGRTTLGWGTFSRNRPITFQTDHWEHSHPYDSNPPKVQHPNRRICSESTWIAELAKWSLQTE